MAPSACTVLASPGGRSPVVQTRIMGNSDSGRGCALCNRLLLSQHGDPSRRWSQGLRAGGEPAGDLGAGAVLRLTSGFLEHVAGSVTAAVTGWAGGVDPVVRKALCRRQGHPM